MDELDKAIHNVRFLSRPGVKISAFKESWSPLPLEGDWRGTFQYILPILRDEKKRRAGCEKCPYYKKEE